MRTLILVGSLTRDTPFFAPARGDGIHVYELDPDSGALTSLSVTGGADNPTYLALDRQQNLLYATSEVFEWHEGLVTSYAIDTATGTLTYINKQPTLGHLSAFVALDAAGRNLLVSNYSMQSSEVLPGRCLVVLPVDHGRIAAAASSVIRAGTGPIADRQERAHAHCLIPLPDGRLATADLGTDEVAFYAFDPGVGIISDRPVETVRLPPGSGPRHIACDTVGEQLFVLNELSSTVAAPRAGRGVRAGTACFDLARWCRRRQSRGGDRALTMRAVPLCQQPRPRQRDGLPHRRRPGADRRPSQRRRDPAQLRHRPVRPLSDRRQPGRSHAEGTARRSTQRRPVG